MRDSQSGPGAEAISRAITSESVLLFQLLTLAGQLIDQLGGVDQVAVMAQRQLAQVRLHLDGLRVADLAGARGGVAVVSYGEMPFRDTRSSSENTCTTNPIAL